MNVSLTPELEAMVEAKVQSGQYNCPNEVVHEALHLLRNHDELRRIRLEELRRDIQVGIDQLDRGEGREIDFEQLKAELLQESESHLEKREELLLCHG